MQPEHIFIGYKSDKISQKMGENVGGALVFPQFRNEKKS
jgi:hypothetical protein